MRTAEQMRAEQRAIQNRWFDEWNRNDPNRTFATELRPQWSYEDEQNRIYAEWLLELQPGDRAHVCFYSDVEPCTVIKRTATTVTIRYDDAELDKSWKPEIELGGFVGHCTNNDEQRWNIFEDPDGRTETFRWSKKSNRWLNTSKCRLYPEWAKKYDYNF